MKSVGWTTLLLVIVMSIVAWAQCGCGVPDEADCYLSFKSNETIEFSLIAPLDYFMFHGTTVSPSIFGWRVEASDGTVVRTVVYPGEPRSRLITMEWDLYDESGYLVPPGSYRIIVMTTDGDVSYPVRIVEACRPCCGCFCCCCPWPITACCIPYGELYLSLGVGEVRSCGGISFSLTFHFECTEP